MSSRVAGRLPPVLLQRSLRVLRPRDAVNVYAHPRPEFARLTNQVREDGAGLRELTKHVDQGAVSRRVDSTFGVHHVQAAHERFAQRGLNGKVAVTF